MITYIIIGITALVSIMAFSSSAMTNKLQFNAAFVVHRKEYYRLVSHAFIHANWTHLLVNMMVLYFFGVSVESDFSYFFNERASLYYILLYGGGILVSNIWALIRNSNNYYYNAVGASGAVSAVLFAYVFFDPWKPLYFFGIIRMPGILFAAGYLVYSYFMSRKKIDNVAHDAHFLGSVFGFLFPVILDPDLLQRFLDKLFRLL